MAMTDGKPAGGKPASVKAGGKPASVKSDLKPADNVKPANSDNWVVKGMKPEML